MTNRANIYAKVRHYRKRGISLKKIGEKVGLSESGVCRILKENRGNKSKIPKNRRVWKMPDEQLYPIPGFKNYSITRSGRVFSNKYQTFVKDHSVKNGYDVMALHLSEGGKFFERTVAALTLMTFSGPRPDGYYAHHNDGNNRNNHIDNLKWAPYMRVNCDQIVPFQWEKQTQSLYQRLITGRLRFKLRKFSDRLKMTSSVPIPHYPEYQ